MLASFSDVEQILIVVVVLYVLELIVWARGNSYVISSQFGGYRLRTERSVLSNERGRLYFSGPFPWDATFIVQPSPLSLGQTAICNVVIAAPGWNDRPLLQPQGLAYAEVDRLRCENYHLLDGDRTFCSLASAMTAKRLLARLRSINQAPLDTRETLIADSVAGQFDVQNVRERIAAWIHSTKSLSVVGTMLFVWVFGVGAALALEWIPATEEPMVTLIGYLAVLFALWWTSAIMTYRAHKRLYPTLGSERAMQTFVAFVSPVAAMRGRDHMARHLFECVHPLPVLHALNATQTTSFAKVTSRDATFPLPLATEFADDLNEDAFESIGQYHAIYRTGLERCIEQIGMSASDLIKRPTMADSETLAYCERCLHEFGDTDARCHACGGRAAQQLNV
jgi:hypothetical protein